MLAKFDPPVTRERERITHLVLDVKGFRFPMWRSHRFAPERFVTGTWVVQRDPVAYGRISAVNPAEDKPYLIDWYNRKEALEVGYSNRYDLSRRPDIEPIDPFIEGTYLVIPKGITLVLQDEDIRVIASDTPFFLRSRDDATYRLVDRDGEEWIFPRGLLPGVPIACTVTSEYLDRRIAIKRRRQTECRICDDISSLLSENAPSIEETIARRDELRRQAETSYGAIVKANDLHLGLIWKSAEKCHRDSLTNPLFRIDPDCRRGLLAGDRYKIGDPLLQLPRTLAFISDITTDGESIVVTVDRYLPFGVVERETLTLEEFDRPGRFLKPRIRLCRSAGEEKICRVCYLHDPDTALVLPFFGYRVKSERTRVRKAIRSAAGRVPLGWLTEDFRNEILTERYSGYKYHLVAWEFHEKSKRYDTLIAHIEKIAAAIHEILDHSERPQILNPVPIVTS